MKAKYYPQSSLLAAGAKAGSSIMCQGVSRVLCSLRDNIYFLPRNGSSVSILEDPWIPTATEFCPILNPSVDSTVLPR